MHSVNLLKVFLLFTFIYTQLFSLNNTLQELDVTKGELRLKFKNKCNQKSIKHFILSNPHRHVFDFKNTRVLKNNMASKLDKNIRVSQFKRNTVRIVIENSKKYTCMAYQPMLMHNSYHIPLPKKAKTLPAKRYNKVIAKKKNKKKSVKDVTLVPVKYHHSTDELIVIDAGHGGHDSGAVSGGRQEKDLVLSISKKVKRKLKDRGFSVYLTRETNRFLKLSERTHIADKKNAIAFISIHANSVAKKHRHKVHGVETFFLQKTRDAKSQRIAARENASVLKGAGSNLSKKVIIDSVLSGPKIVQSNKLAIDVQSNIISQLRSQYSGVRDGGVRHAPFYVLVGASRPSILVEVGYISNPKERKRLFTSGYQNLIAEGIAKGVEIYLDNRKREIDF
ncbi:MAG: N-acetylmuramoyl-L-alanine amidase (EC [uncultured Sulfurovum sp.]|uniref:N-acetylmuramoyl-L-alanine amidase n=1 Tax=uncultured Sulfurovum sp. TaxID=269237 RepID=A0A6S6U6I3_9BACT|nr:MAG: N-acetylmuramoyl-L-alanine amidase (EC [uncultured Sulfurovum sp.]